MAAIYLVTNDFLTAVGLALATALVSPAVLPPFSPAESFNMPYDVRHMGYPFGRVICLRKPIPS
ncbi:MAG: hypothetical protein U0528_08780 [Anaerolineae bacterium]